MKLTHQFSDLDIIPRELMMKAISDEVYQLLMTLSHEGFASLMIGGAVRDFLISGALSKDIDIELRHPFDYSEKEWIQLLNTLANRLESRDGYKIEKLSFAIFRVYLKESVVEISSPRLELYEGSGPWGHSDFTVKLSPKLSIHDSVKRRDFSINTLSIEHGAPGTKEEFKFIDSLNGIVDLKNSIIKNVGDDFTKDPVRFLRMIRFKQRFQLNYDEKMKSTLKNFRLEKLTHYYVVSESLKNSPLSFFKELNTLKKELHLKYPAILNGFDFMSLMTIEDTKFNDGVEFLLALLFRDATSLTKENLSHFCLTFQLKQKLLKDAEIVLAFEQGLRGEGDPSQYIIQALKTYWVSHLIESQTQIPHLNKYLKAHSLLLELQKNLKQDFKKQQDDVTQRLMSVFC